MPAWEEEMEEALGVLDADPAGSSPQRSLKQTKTLAPLPDAERLQATTLEETSHPFLPRRIGEGNYYSLATDGTGEPRAGSS